MKIDPENRRSFVKKSLATSMTVTFAGLIRAHGEEGSGMTNTTVGTYSTSDDNTSMGTFSSTSEATDWGTATTSTTYDTTLGTIQTTMPACGRDYVSRVVVKFTSRTMDRAEQKAYNEEHEETPEEDRPDPPFPEHPCGLDHETRSGVIYYGTLTYYEVRCVNNVREERIGGSYPVQSGGFAYEPTGLDRGDDSDTACPPGNFHIVTTATGDLQGFNFDQQPTDRTDMKVHELARTTDGSGGCVVFDDHYEVTTSKIRDFIEKIERNQGSCPLAEIRGSNRCKAPEPVPMQVLYALGLRRPTYKWKKAGKPDTSPENPSGPHPAGSEAYPQESWPPPETTP